MLCIFWNLFQWCNRDSYNKCLLFTYHGYNSTLIYSYSLSPKKIYSCGFFLSESSLFCYSNCILITPSLHAMGLQWLQFFQKPLYLPWLCLWSYNSLEMRSTCPLCLWSYNSFWDEVNLSLLLRLVNHSLFFHAQF